MRSPFLAALIGCVLAIPAAAHADTFSFSATGAAAGFVGSGTLTAVMDTRNSYLITSLTGPGMATLLAPDAFGNNDNLLFPTRRNLLDFNGFSFSDVMGNTAYRINIYSGSGGRYTAILLDSDGLLQSVPIDFSVTNTTGVTPEPSSLILLGTGMAGLFAFARRKFATA